MSTLLLRLAGPLQSWGTESRFNTRQTGKFPSKSGVVGLLAAALGLQRDADLTPLRNLHFGVRIDQAGSLTQDFHMVHYLKTADVTYRFYLADAVFLVGLESGDEEWLNALEAALKAPAWPLYLGRRSCPPTQPIVLGIRKCALEDALRQEPWLLPEWRQEKWHRKYPNKQVDLPIFTDADGTGYGQMVTQDDPISFNQQHRQYGFRAVEGKIPVTFLSEGTGGSQITEHDAFAEVGVE